MSVRCGNCGDVIFVSNNKDWETDKKRPQMTCERCNPRLSMPIDTGKCKFCGK